MVNEYLSIPAPYQLNNSSKGDADTAFAYELSNIINQHARLGWTYLRSETLAFKEAGGRFSKKEEQLKTFLIFQREVETNQAMVQANQLSNLTQPTPNVEVEHQLKASPVSETVVPNATATVKTEPRISLGDHPVSNRKKPRLKP